MKSISHKIIRKHGYGNGITYHDTIKQENGKTLILDQYFTKRGSSLCYYYSPFLTAFHDSIKLKDAEIIYPKISDPEAFSEFEHLWSDQGYIDGYLYHILSDIPIPVWEHQSYIGGFTNDGYDLDKVLAKLKTFDWVKNASIEKIPWYNTDEDSTDEDSRRTHGIEFDYFIPEKLFVRLYKKYKNQELWSCDIKDQFGSLMDPKVDVFGVAKYRKKSWDE